MKPEALESFLSKATPYHFTIENTCDDLANATINLESLNAGTEKQLQDEYIDAILYETDYHTNLNSQKQLNESMYNDENKVISNSLHAYQLYNFVLQKGETKSFNLLIYMDPNTPMVDANMNATWKGKITLSANYKEEPTANLNGLKVPLVEEGDGLYAVTHDVSEISTDWNKTEYRYAGANVNNYVSFNNEIWRIIGLLNAKTENGVEQRIKIIRQNGVKNQKDFGNYAWDKHTSDLIYDNNWTTSKLKDMLNGIYFESETGDCYTGTNNNLPQLQTCSFNTGETFPKGLDEEAQNMIDNFIIWNLGGYTDVKLPANRFYEKERGTITANNFPSEWSSTTNVGDKFNGIAMMYLSDYGYSVGGEVRNNCLIKNLDEYNTENCNISNWLYDSNNYQWTLSTNSQYSQLPFRITPNGNADICPADISFIVSPVVYLKQAVKITTQDKITELQKMTY